MSVRRLAEPEIQPASFAFNRVMAEQAKNWIKKYPKGREQSAVIPLLMLAQEQEGWVTRAAIEHVADRLGMPYIRVLEVATFYTQFQLKPVGTRAHVQVCGTTPCALRGAEELKNICRSKIHPEQFHTNESGTLSWEEVECLGACVNAPMVMIFKDTYEDLTPDRLAEIIDEFEAGRGDNVPTGPQVDRWFSAPETGFTSLTDEKVFKKGVNGKGRTPRTPAASIPPSNAGKPKTASEQTSPAIKSPSREKASPKKENGTSVNAPAFSARQANKAEPAVEDVVKQRKAPKSQAGPAGSFASPELLKGAPIGAAGKKVAAKSSTGNKSDSKGTKRPGKKPV